MSIMRRNSSQYYFLMFQVSHIHLIDVTGLHIHYPLAYSFMYRLLHRNSSFHFRNDCHDVKTIRTLSKKSIICFKRLPEMMQEIEVLWNATSDEKLHLTWWGAEVNDLHYMTERMYCWKLFYDIRKEVCMMQQLKCGVLESGKAL